MKFSTNRSIVLWCIFLIIVTIQPVSSQTSPFSFRQYTNDKGDTLKYRQLEPDYNPMRKYPLVVFLHGVGECGSDNEAQLKWGVMNFATDHAMKIHPAVVIAPQCPVNMDWSNFSSKDNSTEVYLTPSPSKPMKLLISLIHDLLKKLPVDSNRVYITGLSSGGFGTYDAIERYPHLFAAAVPVCGGGDVSKAASIAHIPLWIFHGSEDIAVNPVFSFDMVEALIKAGAHPGYTSYPETGHFAWLAAYSDELMMEWLFRQHR